MTTDFKDAAHRHWEDAELLGSRGRWPNADHLYGFAAECALKAVMVGLGMQLGPDGKPPKPHAVHIHQLWDQFLTFANGKRQAGYAAMLQQSNPFSTWHESQRYWDSTGIGSADANAHRAGASQTLGVLSQARQDGWVK
ncbi:MAG: SAM-dependent methyltransferase [Thiocapsa sp.]|uniref:SAM-dependent methyltransferase n=1 Tax=Thiocapsa sp. TaxID=2024551 RepID=UPI001BCD01A0|nr:SAM-dependent methyltransferase [Thiocapsa sp.]QVL47243.1 MAG: SAM-dependent methyltransferase [Thiocapsa sp.]